MSAATPEQVLGNLFQFVISMRQKGIGITRKTQALGSAAVDTLRREGWAIVRHDAIALTHDAGYQAGWQAAMEQENPPDASHNSGSSEVPNG
jgi:hypothetical protein